MNLRERRIGTGSAERSSHRASLRVAVCAVAAWVGGDVVNAAGLKPKTLEAFQLYVSVTETRMETELDSETPLLWVDRLPDSEREEAYAHLRAGELVIEQLETRQHGKKIKVPDGLIHHWIGTVLIPDVSLERTLATVQDYDRWSVLYEPNVRQSRLLHRDGSRFKVYLQVIIRRIVTVVLNTEYDIEYVHLDDHHVHARSFSTRITEVEHPGTIRERERPEGQDRGFLRRVRNYCLFEERTGDTYMQCESVSLSADIPLLLKVFIQPIVNDIPKRVFTFMLEATRTRLTCRQRGSQEPSRDAVRRLAAP